MGKYSIKELERLSGIKAHTLRIWEKRYNLFEPARSETNIRYYSDADLRKLLKVAILSANGIKISKIVEMKQADLFEAVQKIEDKDLIDKKRINDLIIPMIEFDEIKFDALYQNYIAELGVEKTFREVIYPFLEKIGLLWLTQEIEPTQEHFVSHIIRQKLSAAIDQLPEPKSNGKKTILFLPEGEYHEIGLLFFAYLYRKRGDIVYYFGQSVSTEQICKASQKIKPHFVVTYCVVRPKTGVQNMLKSLSGCEAEQIYFLQNQKQAKMHLDYPANVKVISSLTDLGI